MTAQHPHAGYWDASVDDTIHMPDSCTIYETERAPQYTGLLNANGTPLYRLPPTVKIGFQLKD